MRGTPVAVELLFDKATSAWANDRTWHPSQEAVITGGRLRLTLQVAATPELVGWILSFGGGVTIARPPDFRNAVQAAADRILAQT